jgi:hypothetical protein
VVLPFLLPLSCFFSFYVILSFLLKVAHWIEASGYFYHPTVLLSSTSVQETGEEVTGDGRNLCKEGLHDLYSLPNNILVMKSRRMRWAGHTAYSILAVKPEGKRSLARPKHRLEDSI